MTKPITTSLMTEARRMNKVWKEANPEGDPEWRMREIASVLDVSPIMLIGKLKGGKSKRKSRKKRK